MKAQREAKNKGARHRFAGDRERSLVGRPGFSHADWISLWPSPGVSCLPETFPHRECQFRHATVESGDTSAWSVTVP